MNKYQELQREPFSLLDAAQHEQLLAAVSSCEFQPGEGLLQKGQPSEAVLLLLDGAVVASDDGDEQDLLFAHYGPGDLLGVYAVIAGRARHSYRADRQTHCLAIPRTLFLALIESNRAFAAFFLDSLSVKQRLLDARSSGDDLAELSSTRIPLDLLDSPLILPPETGLRDAAKRMIAAGKDCFLVQREDRHGIMTRTDLIQAWALHELPDSAPVADLARYELVTLDAQAFIFNALVAMTGHRIARVLVNDGERLLGILELDRVLAHLASHSHMIGVRIEHASCIAELKLAAASTARLVRTLLGRGIKLPYLMDLMTALNDRIISRLFELHMPDEIREHCCLLTLGSEGRGEQILKTDQDNALVLAPGFEDPRLPLLCDQFSEALTGLGYPRCPGNIMVCNQQWRGDEQAWQQRLRSWRDAGDESGHMKLAIFSDARPIAGALQLFEPLSDPLAEVRGKDQFFHHFVRPALHFANPLTLFGGLRNKGGIDLKRAGTFPIVHGVRCLALQQGLRERNTFRRIQGLKQIGRLDAQLGSDLEAAFEVLSSMRVRVELEQPGSDSRVDPGTLDAMQRDLLRDALRVVKHFKSMLARSFHLETL